ncbi:hypothetical protein M8818_006073 [Zalaria obscura]|uniref:Uncharacterized protein n=1 Tax=Zalaria obscura TaxID=2024903 RepID=A0ACC3S7A0_9PEZI
MYPVHAHRHEGYDGTPSSPKPRFLLSLRAVPMRHPKTHTAVVRATVEDIGSVQLKMIRYVRRCNLDLTPHRFLIDHGKRYLNNGSQCSIQVWDDFRRDLRAEEAHGPAKVLPAEMRLLLGNRWPATDSSFYLEALRGNASLEEQQRLDHTDQSAGLPFAFGPVIARLSACVYPRYL